MIMIGLIERERKPLLSLRYGMGLGIAIGSRNRSGREWARLMSNAFEFEFEVRLFRSSTIYPEPFESLKIPKKRHSCISSYYIQFIFFSNDEIEASTPKIWRGAIIFSLRKHWILWWNDLRFRNFSRLRHLSAPQAMVFPKVQFSSKSEKFSQKIPNFSRSP